MVVVGNPEETTMPTYVVRARAGAISPAARVELAGRITAAHAEATGAPRSFVQVFCEDVPDDHGPGSAGSRHMVGGEPAGDTVFVQGHIRAGRGATTTAGLLRALRDAVVEVVGVPAAAVWVYLAELPPTMMLEFGEVLPPPGEEEAWRAALPDDTRRRMDALDGRGAP